FYVFFLFCWQVAVLLCFCFCLAQGRRHKSSKEDDCFPMNEVEGNEKLVHHFVGKHVRWDRYPSVFLVQQLEENESDSRRKRRHHRHGCPVLRLQNVSASDYSQRSISPWRYRIDFDENRYPQKLAFAECLCSGCINVSTGKETSSMNSVVIEQTMMVLFRRPCAKNPKAYSFEVDYIKVPVGCTCVLPKM
uniref:Interleukin 17C n=1 Tax=Latimeria chalumnae TaxID=7897 RepID=H3AFQ3_LATCH